MTSKSRPIAVFVILLSIAAGIAPAGLAQSGRGRPKVPNPESANPPVVVKIPENTAVIQKEQTSDLSRFVLKNGMTVVIEEKHTFAMATVAAYFKVGIRDETSPGLARLITRLMMRNPSLGGIRNLGGDVMSQTSYAGTLIQASVGSDKVKEAIALQSDMIQHPAFMPDEVARQLELAAIESASLAGDPPRFTDQKLLGMLLPVPPVSQPALSTSTATTGTGPTRPATVTPAPAPPSGSPATQAAAMYASRYTPDNLTIVVTGDVNLFEVLVKIEESYGPFGLKPEASSEQSPAQPATRTAAGQLAAKPARQTSAQTPVKAQVKPAPAATAPQPAAQASEPAPPPPALSYQQDRGDLTQAIVSVGFGVSSATDRDRATLDVLSALVGLGPGSRLDRLLDSDQQLASRFESRYLSLPGPKLAGALSFKLWTPPASLDRAITALFQQLDKIRRDPPSAAELARAVAMIERRRSNELDTFAERAEFLARQQSTAPGLRSLAEYPALVRSIKPDDVLRAASTWLLLSNARVHEFLPYSSPARTFDSASYAAAIGGWAPGFVQLQPPPAPPERTASMQSKPAAEQRVELESVQPLPVHDFSTLNGPRALVKEDHSRPEVTVAVLFQGGRISEDEKNSGITELMMRTMMGAVNKRKARGPGEIPELATIVRDLAAIGTQIEPVVEPDFFGYLLHSRSAHASESLKAARELIENPQFTDVGIARARLEQIGAMRDTHDLAAARSVELFRQVAFPGSGYSFPVHGREAVITQLKNTDLSGWYDKTIKMQLPFIVIVGDTDGSALVSDSIVGGFRRRELNTTFPARIPVNPLGSETAESVRRPVSEISLGWIGPKGGSGELSALRVIEAMMNGPGGRLGDQIETKQGLGVDAELETASMQAGGGMYVSVAGGAGNETRARSAIVAEIRRIGTGQFSADEMNSAQRRAALLALAEFQDPVRLLLEYARATFYGGKPTDVDELPEHLQSMSPDDVKRASAAFKPNAFEAGVVRGVSPGSSAPAPAKP